MNWKDKCRKQLILAFKGAFFNANDEFIAHKKSNTYFIFNDCENELDVKCKILEWFSRPTYKGTPYKQDKKNKEFRQFMLNGINAYLGTNFSFEDMVIIYTYLGNSCNRKKTLEFLQNNFDMNLFND